MKKFTTPVSTFQCPQCGYELPLYFKYTKLVKCVSCKSSIFLEDDAVKLAGKSSVLADEPSLLKIGVEFDYKQTRFLPIGKIRYSYGRGFWEEWWLKDSRGESWWLSVDEGDFVLEQKIDSSYDDIDMDKLKIGDRLDEWFVSEIGDGVCEGFEGSLPKNIEIGSSYRYLHLSSFEAKLRTIEIHEDKIEVYEGKWIDALDIGIR